MFNIRIMRSRSGKLLNQFESAFQPICLSDVSGELGVKLT